MKEIVVSREADAANRHVNHGFRLPDIFTALAYQENNSYKTNQ